MLTELEQGRCGRTRLIMVLLRLYGSSECGDFARPTKHFIDLTRVKFLVINHLARIFLQHNRASRDERQQFLVQCERLPLGFKRVLHYGGNVVLVRVEQRSDGEWRIPARAQAERLGRHRPLPCDHHAGKHRGSPEPAFARCDIPVDLPALSSMVIRRVGLRGRPARQARAPDRT